MNNNTKITFTNEEIKKFQSFLWEMFGNKYDKRLKTNRSDDGKKVLGYEDNFKDEIRYYCVSDISNTLDRIYYKNLRELPNQFDEEQYLNETFNQSK